MKKSSLRFYCVLIICFLAQLVDCEANVDEGVDVKSAAQCLGINVQVRNLDEDILTVTGKKNDYVISYDFLTSADDPASNLKGGKQRYSIGLHLSSLKLHLTLNVDNKCETEKWNGLKGRRRKLFKTENGIEISLEYSSSTSASTLTQQMLNWIILQFNSLKNMTVIAYEFLVDKVAKGLQWITRPLKKLKEKITESIYCYLKPKIDNPILIIEVVLEVIWRVVKPVLQAGEWLCEFMAAVIKQAKVKTAEFLKKYPIVLYYSKNCKIVGSHVFSVIAQWPFGWQDSIEYVGFAWVIIYFMFNLIKFSAMDERKLHRTARSQDSIHCSPRKTGNKPKLM